MFQGPSVPTRVGLLMLLCHWLADCPIAVTHFLHNSANVPFVSSVYIISYLLYDASRINNCFQIHKTIFKPVFRIISYQSFSESKHFFKS